MLQTENRQLRHALEIIAKSVEVRKPKTMEEAVRLLNQLRDVALAELAHAAAPMGDSLA